MTKLAQIPVAKIKASPHNPRHEAVDIDGLAKSIAEVGVIEPLVLSEDPKGPGTYHVTCGSRRLAASKKAGLTSVPAVILGDVGEKSERVVSLVENLHRRDMTHIETGEAFVALIKLGMSPEEVAQASGVTRPVVDDKVRIVRRCLPEIQDLVHRDRLPLADAVKLSRCSESEQRVALAAGLDRRQKGSHKTHKRRISNVEAALRKAAELWVAGDPAMAYTEAARATRLIKDVLEDAAHLRTTEVEMPAKASTNGNGNGNGKVPAAEGKGKVRCPHCLESVRIRYGQTRADALEEHGVDRPLCRPKIRALVKA